MSDVPVYTGPWIDWSAGRVLGNYRTFSVTDTLYIVGATGAYLTVVGGSVWSIWAFALHRLLSSRSRPDVIDLQHRNIYRNTSTAVSAIIDAFWIYWWWKPWKLCGDRQGSDSKTWLKRFPLCHTREKRATHTGLRACGLILPAFLIFAFFVIAGILGSHIAYPAYRSNTVLVRDGTDNGKCGITLFDTTIDANVGFDIDALARTRAAVAYARSCYSSASEVTDSITCSSFAKPRLNYTTAAVGCPFGDPEIPVDQTICGFNTNNVAFALQTDHLNSHDHFGINAPSKERIDLYKEMVCSPLVLDNFTLPNAAELPGGRNETHYLYGSVPVNGDYTYAYNPEAAYANVPFSLTALMHNTTGPAPWMPISNLTRSDADVAIVFIAPNSILYRNQVKDPLFQATYSATYISNAGERFTVYDPDNLVVVVACTEQYSICNPNFKDRCTPLDGQTALLHNIDHIGLNEPQYVTAIRMVYMINDGNTYSSVNGIGPDALQMWNEVDNLITPAIPDNQWQIEVQGWLDTTLARWQAYMVNYAYNTVALDLHTHVGFPISNDSLESHWRSQCRNQKISNVGRYQNVSVFGFSMIWAAGGVIIILSLSLKLIVKTCRKVGGRTHNEDSETRRLAWNIDGKFQQQRLALQTAGYYDLIGGEDDVPTLNHIARLPLPFQAMEEPHRETGVLGTGWSSRVERTKEVALSSRDVPGSDRLDDAGPNGDKARGSSVLVTQLDNINETRREAQVDQTRESPHEPLPTDQPRTTHQDVDDQSLRILSTDPSDDVVASTPSPNTFHQQTTRSPP